MAKKAERIYLCTLDRFGYDLTVVGHTEDECKKKMMREYVRAYKLNNEGNNPRNDIYPYTDMTYYEAAENDLSIIEMEIGKVEWL